MPNMEQPFRKVSYLEYIFFQTVIFKQTFTLLLFILTFSQYSLVVSAQIQTAANSEGSANTSPGIFALPEIHIKLKNGTTLELEPNTPVELSQELQYVELGCAADYPIKWEYLVMNKSIPVLDVVYRRLLRRNNSSDFSNPKRNRFIALIALKGLREFQTGKYLCRHYNEKLDNNSYAISSYFDIFIPGNKTFNEISLVKFMNKTAAPFVSIHCPITNVNLHVRLYKLSEKHFNKTKEILWKPIYANYEPTDGFKLFAGLGRELLGTYNCTADNGASLISVIADVSEKELYHSSSPGVPLNESCWANFKFIQYIRSKRLECFCKDSFGLFMNDNFEFENRQASCSSFSSLLKEVRRKCADWRVEEFFMNGENGKSDDICFRREKRKTRTMEMQLTNDMGSGSRPSLIVQGETFPNGDNQRNFSFTTFNVTYNGFVDWAGDFKLAICRDEVCLQNGNNNDMLMLANDRNYQNTGFLNNKVNKFSSLEYFENEPTRRQYFPLAHYQAVWTDFIVNGNDVKLVYVFQADSLTYAWFPYATKKIEWGNVRQMEKVDFDFPSSPSSSSKSWNIRIIYFVFGTFLVLLVEKLYLI